MTLITLVNDPTNLTNPTNPRCGRWENSLLITLINLMTSLDIENDTQKRQIHELEQFVILLSAALTNNDIASGGNGSGEGLREANLIKQFAGQFNLSLDMENIKNESKNNMSLQDKISQALGRMDLLLKENFDLKREIVFERKKYVDL